MHRHSFLLTVSLFREWRAKKRQSASSRSVQYSPPVDGNNERWLQIYFEVNLLAVPGTTSVGAFRIAVGSSYEQRLNSIRFSCLVKDNFEI